MTARQSYGTPTTAKKLKTFPRDLSSMKVALSDDGRFAVTGAETPGIFRKGSVLAVIYWSADSGKQLHIFRDRAGVVTARCGDGKLIVTDTLTAWWSCRKWTAARGCKSSAGAQPGSAVPPSVVTASSLSRSSWRYEPLLDGVAVTTRRHSPDGYLTVTDLSPLITDDAGKRRAQVS
jgi:hypothetical protein